MREPKVREQLDLEIDSVERNLDGILNYIKENPESDPNAYEMNNVMFEVADIGFFGRKFEDVAYDFLHDEKYINIKAKFNEMMDYRLKQFVEEDKKLECSSLYEYFTTSINCMATLNRLDYSENHEEVKQLFNSICGVNLYIHQRVRELKENNNENAIIYDNEVENTRNIIGWADYQDEVDSPFSKRDEIANKMYEEIQGSYQKTVSEFVEQEIVTKK